MSQPYRSVAAERRPDPAKSFHISVAADDFMQVEAGFALLSAGRRRRCVKPTINPEIRKRPQPSRLVELRRELARKFSEHLQRVRGKGCRRTSGVSASASTPAPRNPTTYEPNLTVFVQGRKRLTMGTHGRHHKSLIITR